MSTEKGTEMKIKEISVHFMLINSQNAVSGSLVD